MDFPYLELQSTAADTIGCLRRMIEIIEFATTYEQEIEESSSIRDEPTISGIKTVICDQKLYDQITIIQNMIQDINDIVTPLQPQIDEEKEQREAEESCYDATKY